MKLTLKFQSSIGSKLFQKIEIVMSFFQNCRKNKDLKKYQKRKMRELLFYELFERKPG